MKMTIQILHHRFELVHRVHYVRRAPRTAPTPPDLVVCAGALLAWATIMTHVLSLIAGGAL